MSLLELQERIADAVLGASAPPELERFRRMVRAKRRRGLHDACPLSFHHVPCEVVDRFLDTTAPDETNLSREAEAFRAFASEQVTPPVRDALAAETLEGAGVFSIDLRRLRRGELAPCAPHWWLGIRGRRPIRLWRARPPREHGG